MKRSSSNGRGLDRALIEARGVWRAGDLITQSRCPLCSSESHRTVVTREDGLPIQECIACGLAYVDPRPSSRQLADYYSSGYFSGQKDFFKGKDYCLERDSGIGEGAVTGYREIASNLEIENKVILDIGCASGALLQVLRRHHPKELIGVDTSDYPVTFGKTRYGLDLRCESLHSAAFANNYFDLITAIDTIEHVEDLTSFLSELRRVLKPDGSVFLITPNFLAYELARDEWTCLYKDFEHLQYLSPRSLIELCRSTGLKLQKAWTDTQPFRVFEYPRLYKNRLHAFFYPHVAVRNGLARYKYQRAVKVQPHLGANFNLVLSVRNA